MYVLCYNPCTGKMLTHSHSKQTGSQARRFAFANSSTSE